MFFPIFLLCVTEFKKMQTKRRKNVEKRNEKRTGKKRFSFSLHLAHFYMSACVQMIPHNDKTAPRKIKTLTRIHVADAAAAAMKKKKENHKHPTSSPTFCIQKNINLHKIQSVVVEHSHNSSLGGSGITKTTRGGAAPFCSHIPLPFKPHILQR